MGPAAYRRADGVRFTCDGELRREESSAYASSRAARGAMAKAAWTPEEDDVLKALIATHGACNWSSIAKGIPGRSSKSCRLRWCNQLNPAVKRSAFTEEEDRLILEEQAKYGNKWAIISRAIPGRTDNQIKNRFNSTLRRRLPSTHMSFHQAPPSPSYSAGSFDHSSEQPSLRSSPEESPERETAPLSKRRRLEPAALLPPPPTRVPSLMETEARKKRAKSAGLVIPKAVRYVPGAAGANPLFAEAPKVAPSGSKVAVHAGAAFVRPTTAPSAIANPLGAAADPTAAAPAAPAAPVVDAEKLAAGLVDVTAYINELAQAKQRHAEAEKQLTDLIRAAIGSSAADTLPAGALAALATAVQAS